MAERDLPFGLGLKTEWVLGADTWKAGMDNNLFLTSLFAQLVVKDFVAAEPIDPEEGDIVLVTNNGNVHVFDTGVWKQIAARPGFKAHCLADGKTYVRDDNGLWVEYASGGGGDGIEEAPEDGTAYVRKDGDWVPESGGGDGGGDDRYRLAFFATTPPAANEVLFLGVVDREIEVPANFAGQYVRKTGNPSVDLVLSVRDGGTEFGTITISAAGAITLATTGGAAHTIGVNSIVSVVSQATVVTGISNLVATLWGVRT